MQFVNRIVICAVALTCAAFPAFAGNVFVLPSSPFEANVPAYVDNPFQSLGNVSAALEPLAVIAKPDGTKFYVVSRSTTDTVVIYDDSLTTVLRRISLAEPARAAALSPDGKRLLVLAGRLHVFDTTTATDDEMALSPLPDVGLNPNDLAFSHDSKRAFILSDESDQLAFFDLATNQIAGSPIQAPAISGLLTGVSVAPNGLVYVSGTNRFYEIDGSTGTLRGEIGLNALPRKAVFTPDGLYAVLLNRTPVTGSLAILVDLRTRSVTATIPSSGGNAGLELDQLAVVGDTSLFAVSTTTQRLVRITINPFQLQTAAFPFSNRLGVMVAATSGELPAAKHVFVATNDTISRGVVASSQTEDLSLPLQPRRLVVTRPASTATPVNVRKFNDEQNVVGGSTTLPLMLRVWDINGIPVFNRAVQFTATAPGVTIENASTSTNIEGFAGTRVTVPSTPGPITISALVNGLAAPVDFTVTVAGGDGGGEGGGVSILSGDGQIVPRGFATAEPYNERLRVIVRDSAGQPIIGAQVNWTVTGEGSLSAVGSTGKDASSLTDINGVASMIYVGPSFIAPTTSWVQATVSATAAGLNTVDFTVTSVPNLPDGNPAIPTILLTKPPQEDRTLSGQAGQTLVSGVEFQVTAIAGFQSGQGIPGIGVQVMTDLDPLTSPSASCKSPSSLTDATGTGTCDVVFGGVIGTAPVKIKIAGLREFFAIVNVTPGPPGLVKIIGGNNQSGDPGQALPVLLQAEISDGFGHVLPDVPVTWEPVVAGRVTISQASTVTDAMGRVSAKATLGSVPGEVQIRLRAGSAQAIFTLFVNVSITGLTKVSGDNQVAVVGQAFAQTLVVRVLKEQSQPVVGAQVSFSVTSGSATLGSPSATTDSEGRASTTVTAGSSAGPVVVTAGVADLSATFNLTVVPPGPIVSKTGIRSAISGEAGVSPGSVVAIYGNALAPGIVGSVVGNNLVGPLPYKLANVEVLFGTTPAPIYSVNNVSGQEFVVVQAPFSLAAPGVVPVTIKVGGGSTVVNDVDVKAYQPGIFEALDSQAQLYAVLLRPDGSYVGPNNPAKRGERIRMFCSGLGQTTPATGTNFAGIPGQTVQAPLTVGINSVGVPIVSSETMVGVVGVYVVTFDVPMDAATGQKIPLSYAVSPMDGSPWVFSNSSTINIQ